MPIDRFYFDGPLAETIVLKEAEFHHLRVTRIEVGEQVEIINGQGSIADAVLESVAKHSATFSLSNIQKAERLPYHFILAVPLMRPSKLELVIEKCTELGADAFYFYKAEHSEKTDLSENQLERLRNLSVSALKQSGRMYLPSIEILSSIEELFKTEAIYLYGDVDPKAPKIAKEKLEKTMMFISGPERGFSTKEKKFLTLKARGVSINPNILRAETAPITALSILSTL